MKANKSTDRRKLLRLEDVAKPAVQAESVKPVLVGSSKKTNEILVTGLFFDNDCAATLVLGQQRVIHEQAQALKWAFIREVAYVLLFIFTILVLLLLRS
jgi:hypothetical protein